MVADQSTEVVLSVDSTRYDRGHPAWQEQVDLLRKQLHEVSRTDTTQPDDQDPLLPVVLRLSGEPDEGTTPTKGLLEISSLVLASAGMIRAIAVVIREWRRQDSSRRVSIKLKRGNESIEIEAQGAGNTATAIEALHAALESTEDEDR